MKSASTVWKPGMRARTPSGEIVEVFEVYEGEWLGEAYFEVHTIGADGSARMWLAYYLTPVEEAE